MATSAGNGEREQLIATQLSAYPANAVDDAKLTSHRYKAQTWMGVGIAVAILSALIITVGLIAYLAIANRKETYIASVGQTLQPFVLPTLGALAGYALRAAQDKPDDP